MSASLLINASLVARHASAGYNAPTPGPGRARWWLGSTEGGTSGFPGSASRLLARSSPLGVMFSFLFY